MSPVGMTVLCSVGFILALGWVYRRMSVAGSGDQITEQWWSEFTPERYAAMGRLLAKDDFGFVRHLPGYRGGMERRLRSRRIAIFSSFLKEMRRDFDSLNAVGQALMISRQHQPGFQDELFRLRVRFLRSWWMVRAELVLYRLGIDVVDPSALVASLRGTAYLYAPELMPSPVPA